MGAQVVLSRPSLKKEVLDAVTQGKHRMNKLYEDHFDEYSEYVRQEAETRNLDFRVTDDHMESGVLVVGKAGVEDFFLSFRRAHSFAHEHMPFLNWLEWACGIDPMEFMLHTN